MDICNITLLQLYRIENGNVNVKSTDRKHGDLYSWIVQLRKDYKTRERDPSESPLTEAQISVLESVRFAFTTRGEEHWQKSYERLKEYKANHGHVLVPRQCEIQGLGDWVRQYELMSCVCRNWTHWMMFAHPRTSCRLFCLVFFTL